MDTKRSFEDAPRVEDREQLLPKSEAEAASSVEGENWPSTSFRTARQPKRRAFIAAVRDYWWLLNTGLLITLIGLQLVMWRDIRAGSQDCSHQLGGDYKNEGPICTLSNRAPRVSMGQPQLMRYSHDRGYAVEGRSGFCTT